VYIYIPEEVVRNLRAQRLHPYHPVVSRLLLFFLDVINFKCMARPYFSTGKVLSACLVALLQP
jgi:hypothetical protein